MVGKKYQKLYTVLSLFSLRAFFLNRICLACIAVILCVLVYLICICYTLSVFVVSYVYLLYLMCICCTLMCICCTYVYFVNKSPTRCSLFHFVYLRSTCFGHGACPSSGVVCKNCRGSHQCVSMLVVSVNVITNTLKRCAFCV